MKLAKAPEMQQLDRTAIEDFGIPGIVLMENAGRGTVAGLISELGPVEGKLVPIFVGPGNNGGDGLVIARRVHQSGGMPYLVYLVEPDKLKGDAAINGAVTASLGLASCSALADDQLDAAFAEIRTRARTHQIWAIIDALFGTGLQRPLTGKFLAAVRGINQLKAELACPVAAVDIPSGLNSDTGGVMGDAVTADLTMTYGLAKPGHYINGTDLTGRVEVIDIGIPAAAVDQAGLAGEVLDRSVLEHISPRRSAAHKGNFGHLLILAGSTGKTGAAMLSSMGALRAGTGLVTLCVPADLNAVFEANLIEAMTIPLAHSMGCLTIDDYDVVKEALIGKSAVVLGPGLGTDTRTSELVARLYREVDLPMVVDADALNILAREPDLVADPPAARLLTPHPGEMARLTGRNPATIQEDRLEAALSFSGEVNRSAENVTLILKGAGTVVCDPGGTWAINASGNPGMAAGGMGDVLAGLLAGLLAQRYPVATAARLGVYLHGLAADRLAQTRKFGYLASEVAAAIPEIIAEFM